MEAFFSQYCDVAGFIQRRLLSPIDTNRRLRFDILRS